MSSGYYSLLQKYNLLYFLYQTLIPPSGGYNLQNVLNIGNSATNSINLNNDGVGNNDINLLPNANANNPHITLSDGSITNTIDKNGYTTRNSIQNSIHYLNFSDSSSTGTGAIQKNASISVNPSTYEFIIGTILKLDGVGGNNKIALGNNSGSTSQGNNSIAIGNNSGKTSQGTSSVAIGNNAGSGTVSVFQGTNSVAIGTNAGQNGQGQSSVCIGANAGNGSLSAIGQNAICIGTNAGQNSANANSICINASGTPLNPTQQSVFISPVRSASGPTLLHYNNGTKEMSFLAITVSKVFTNIPNFTGLVSGTYYSLITSGINFTAGTYQVIIRTEIRTGTATGLFHQLEAGLSTSNASFVNGTGGRVNIGFVPITGTGGYSLVGEITTFLTLASDTILYLGVIAVHSAGLTPNTGNNTSYVEYYRMI